MRNWSATAVIDVRNAKNIATNQISGHRRWKRSEEVERGEKRDAVWTMTNALHAGEPGEFRCY